MKNLFKYDFLKQNKGIQSAIIGVLFCVFIAIPKYNTPSVIVWFLIWAVSLFVSCAFFDKWFLKQNFNKSQLSTFNKAGWVIYIISFMVAFCVILWRS